MPMTWPIPGDGFPYERRSRPATHPEAATAWRVLTRLRDDAVLRDERITVEVQNRVAILHGTVRSAEARDLAARLARGVGTVDDVCNCLRLAGLKSATTPIEAGTDPFDDLVRHLTGDATGTARRAARTSQVAAASGLLLAVGCALVLIPRDQEFLFGAVAVAATLVGILYPLRRNRS